MRRRRVVRFIVGYAAAGFVALQLAEIVFPAFGLGETALRLTVVAVGLGFLPAVVLAWIFDLTRQGIRRTRDDPTKGPPVHGVVVLAFAFTALTVSAAVTWYVLEHDVLGPGGPGDSAVAYLGGEPIRALAVLPFADFSPDSGQAYLAAGMHEELIARLSMLEGVRVVSRTSVMRYAGTTLSMPEIGRELGVDVVIEGSVARSGNRVRVTLRIIHAPTDSHLKTLQFDREMDDVFALQTEVAHAVAHEIGGVHEESDFALTANEVDPTAQDAYMRGRLEYDRGTAEGARAALAYFEDAVEADPDFARALAAVAGSRFLVGLDQADPSDSTLERARQEALAALALDTTSMEVREVLGLIERNLARSATATEAPSAVTGLGRQIEDRVRRVTAPAGVDAARGSVSRARSLLAAGRYREATDELEREVATSPTDQAAWELLPRAYVGAGDAAAAADAVRRWQMTGLEGTPDSAAVARLTRDVAIDGATGFWRWQLERLTAREAAGRPVPRIEVAAAHAALGQRDQAISLIREALAARERGLTTLTTDRVWDALRGDVRFQQLERRARQIRFREEGRPAR